MGKVYETTVTYNDGKSECFRSANRPDMHASGAALIILYESGGASVIPLHTVRHIEVTTE